MKKITRKIIAVLLFAGIISFLFSCEKTKGPNSRVFYEYFDTVGTLYDYSGASYQDFCEIADGVEGVLAEYHRLCDIYNEYDGLNNVATLNSKAGKGAVKLDAKLLDVLDFGIEMYYATGGEVNIAFGAVTSLWHEAREDGTGLPDTALLEEASLHTDIEMLVINREAGTAELIDGNMRLDLGAIAKGYAVEMAAKYINGNDLSSYVLDMGGNLRAVGAKPDGAGWKCAVRNPSTENGQPYVAYHEIKDNALVTSGGYERYYTVGGVRYHHIIDKDTLFPKDTYLSVSVLAPSSAVADALSTAVFNMELDEAESLVGSFPGVKITLVMKNGEVREITGTVWD